MHVLAFSPVLLIQTLFSLSLPAKLWPRYGEPRCDRRPGDGGGGGGGPTVQRGHQVRHNYARWESRGGVQAQADVAFAQRHHPQHPGRHGVQGGHHLQEHPPPGARLDQAHHHRQARPWRSGTAVHKDSVGHFFQLVSTCWKAKLSVHSDGARLGTFLKDTMRPH